MVLLHGKIFLDTCSLLKRWKLSLGHPVCCYFVFILCPPYVYCTFTIHYVCQIYMVTMYSLYVHRMYDTFLLGHSVCPLYVYCTFNMH